jgi:lycopene beta-cyclase
VSSERSGAPSAVSVVGDGPAGLAIAAACRQLGMAVTVHGTGEAWHATYATWRDDVPDLPDSVFATLTDRVEVVGRRRHVIDRTYALFDNAALRAHLLDGLHVEHGRVDPHELARAEPDRVVVDATGAVGSPAAWQTAHGVVLAEVPPALDLPTDAVTLMDWRPAGGLRRSGGHDGPPSFCYVVPVADGWLVEETVLAANPAVAPEVLRDRLVSRLGPSGRAVLDEAARVEGVRIPMGSRPRRGEGNLVPFGAAAGFVHPATGYSVAASLRAAPRVAHAIAAGADLSEAVWPRAQLRARALHDYGLDALLRLDAAATAAFFDAFFELPQQRWADYLRVDTTPAAVAGVMRRVFWRAPWTVRRRLMAGDPRRLVRRSADS